MQEIKTNQSRMRQDDLIGEKVLLKSSRQVSGVFYCDSLQSRAIADKIRQAIDRVSVAAVGQEVDDEARNPLEEQRSRQARDPVHRIDFEGQLAGLKFTC